MISWWCFEIAAPKTLENSHKNVGFPFNRVARIQSTAYYQTALQIHSGSAQKGKDVLKFEKFKKKLCETVSLSLMIKPCSPEFLTSANTDSKKNVSFEYSEIAGSLPEKGL